MMTLALVMLLAMPAAAQLSGRERLLKDGDWNQRIHAAIHAWIFIGLVVAFGDGGDQH